MHLFNASSLFDENAKGEIARLADQPDELRARLIEIKKKLLETYRFQVYNVPEDFTMTSYILATNHLTDSDAPLIISFYYALMQPLRASYPEMFIFAKENCFNGVSLPQEFLPILEMEKVYGVDRKSLGGAKAAMRAAGKWFAEGEKPKHFLIFPQGTIYDINKDKAEDIEPGAFWLARLLDIPVLPAFIEQAVEGSENHLVFGEPMVIPQNCRDFSGYKQLWLERVIEAQDSLERLTGTPAREAALDEEHQTRKRFTAANP